MTRKEYKEILNHELYKDWKLSPLSKFRLKYFSPNTNCMYLCRKMWYLHQKGGLASLVSKFYYNRIMHKYGCCIYSNATVGRGFSIVHPVGIVIGKAEIGENFTIYQNCTVGVRRENDESKGLTPKIGNNVKLCSNSLIIGNVTIADDVTIGAQSLVINSIDEAGVYVGSPVKKVK